MDLTQLWESMLEAMRRQIGHQDVEIWLRSAKPINLEADTLLVEVSNRYYADWIEENYLEDLCTEASSLVQRSVQIKFTWREDQASSNESPQIQMNFEQEVEELPRSIGVNTTQTFESFVIGECNKFAHAAAAAVADHPAKQYNPLFIYGSTGLGKTHLMHAVANRVLAEQSSSRVVYVTAEDFMNEMINCLRYKCMDDFRSKYRRRSTVLLVDDVQFLSGKERTQEEFFHTFNALQGSGRQIILTSDVVPREIDKLEPRLRTRFEGGLLADMQAPDKETLLAILMQKADSYRLNIPPDLAEAIAGIVEGNIRELEGILNRISALHHFYNEPITLEWVQRRLPGEFDPPSASVTVAAIIEAVARFHNLRSVDITGSKRTRALTRPRHIAMFLARTHTSLSFPELGREFGGRDHSTIQHGYHKVREELEVDPDLAYKVKLIEQGLHIRT
ncbi:MAG TPA: chromosomal replication initiator protein DnaA [Deltaproteobacteria bacterium]|nr:chromosomal replication initiator protein DnaA [Deltaproteobacteria bacterium]